MAQQRPPRIPGSRPKQKPFQSPTMIGFRQKVANANDTSICNATENVRRLTMRQLLTMDQGYEVPIFQRRYCWTSVQWKTILSDAMLERKNPLGVHWLGRLTCTNSKNTGGRSCILDGQQRLTTVTLLLASIRDAVARTGSPSDAVVESINKILFPDNEAFVAWANTDNELSTGMELSFVKLIPSFSDRSSYFKSILPGGDQIQSHYSDQPLQAKRYFDEALVGLSKEDLYKLHGSVLDGFIMLYFPIDTDTGVQDGTADMMVVYERLALRDATFTRPTRSSEYLSMGGCDMIRNLLLGSFAEIADSREFYTSYWLPLEHAAETASRSSRKEFGIVLEDVFKTFLASKEHEGQIIGIVPTVGGKIYADFQSWFQGELERSSSSDLEDEVREIGQLLLDHANEYAEKA